MAVLVSLQCCWSVYGDEHGQVSEPWIRGTAEHLEMRIQGQILDFDGSVAESPSITAIIRDNNSTESVEVNVKGDLFEIWLPVYREDWHSVRIHAESRDKQHCVGVSHMRPALRQLAMMTQVLTLQPSTRSVKANVVHDDKPVAHANLKVETTERGALYLQCDAAGSVKVHLMPKEKIRSFTAWTDDPLFGGFQFSRQPVRDREADSQTIEVFACRDQRFRVVDGEGSPCPGVEMHLQVATPPPNYNYLGSIEASRMTTNQDGEAVFRWFPDWEEVHCYVDLYSKQWVIDGKAKWIDGDFVVQVKPRRTRQKVSGRLAREAGSKAGYCVFWRSFQGEQEGRSDHLTAVTDQQGNFTAEVLPDATYCVFINDPQDVSNMIDLIPAPSNKPPETAILNLQNPELLEISVTAGPAKRPMIHQSVYVRQTHDYQWMEDGELRSGSSARDRYVHTDDQGKATAAVESGKNVEVSIYNSDWRTSEEMRIVAGQPNTIAIHRVADEPRPIFGVVLQDEENPIPTDEIMLLAGSVDGKTRGTEQVTLRDDGVFIFQTQAVAVGVLAATKDNSMAGVIVAENPRRVLRLKLQPTAQLKGRLIDSDGKPVRGRPVHAIVRVTYEPKNEKLNTFYGFEPARQSVETDDDGYFTFVGMPRDVEIAVSAEALSKQRNHWLGTRTLKAGQEPTLETHTIDD